MPVRFGRSPRPEVRQVLQHVVNAPLFVVLGADPSFDRETNLHWLPAQARAVPCTNEDCPWCPSPFRICTYVPVLAYTSNGRHWKEKVLPVNWGMRDLLDEEREHVIWEVGRVGKKNSKVTWQRYDREKYCQRFAGFDVEPSLFRLWGMYKDAKRTAAHPGEDALRLFGTDGEHSAAS